MLVFNLFFISFTYYIKQYLAARFVDLECKEHRLHHTYLDPIEVYHHTIPMRYSYSRLLVNSKVTHLSQPNIRCHNLIFFVLKNHKHILSTLFLSLVRYKPHRVIALTVVPNRQLTFHYYF